MYTHKLLRRPKGGDIITPARDIIQTTVLTLIARDSLNTNQASEPRESDSTNNLQNRTLMLLLSLSHHRAHVNQTQALSLLLP